MPAKSAVRLFLLVLLGSGLLVGCAQIRKATYPSGFVYLEQKEITNEMLRLSFYMRKIEGILSDDAATSSDQQAQIVGLLAKIDASTNRLGAGSVETNHFLIDSRIDQFKADVNTALFDARSNPPNYYALGRLSGSCTACHQYR